MSDVFDYDDDGIVLFADDHQASTMTLSDRTDALLAAKSCPTKAISVD